nr:increased DNA methylation 1-like [Ipomoea trifida]
MAYYAIVVAKCYLYPSSRVIPSGDVVFLMKFTICVMVDLRGHSMSIKFLLRCSLKIVKEKRSVNVTGLINCESDDGKETTPSCFPGSGNSAFVVSKDSYCKIEESSGVKKLSEKRLMPSMDIINGPAPKYRKVSGNEKDILQAYCIRKQECVRGLINCIEKMLSSFKFEKLVKSAIPSVVDIIALGFGFKPLEEEERSSLSNNNLMLFPRTMWLKNMSQGRQADK